MAPSRNRAPKVRRAAKTRQGQDIVAAILDAAAELLADGGSAALTTNRLAERAGVSIGSLYHYFPNKEAVVAKLAERMEERAAKLLAERRRAMPERVDKDAVIRRLSTTLVSDELGAAATRRALLTDVPLRWIETAARARQARVHRLLGELLAERENVREGDGELMSFVLAHAVRGIIEGALMYRPDLFESPGLVDEIFELVSRYTASARASDGDADDEND
jgi:AcrR family transcriptional regulator